MLVRLTLVTEILSFVATKTRKLLGRIFARVGSQLLIGPIDRFTAAKRILVVVVFPAFVFLAVTGINRRIILSGLPPILRLRLRHSRAPFVVLRRRFLPYRKKGGYESSAVLRRACDIPVFSTI